MVMVLSRVGYHNNNNHCVFICAECGFAFIPSEGPSNLRITLDLRLANRTRNTTEVEEPVTVPTFKSDNTTLVDATIAMVNDTPQAINGLFCHIISLEVYRGPRLSTVISHNGFSLSNSGALEVIKWSDV